MRATLSATSVLAVVLAMSAGSAPADTITLGADHWCPFNCDPDAENPGFMVEIATEALGLYGHEVVYQVMNWSRSLDFVRAGRIDGVIGTEPEESPGLIFGPAMAMYQEVAAFRQGEGLEIASVASLEGLRLGAISDYNYADAIKNYIHAYRDDRNRVQMLAGDNALRQNLLKLVAGRVDVVPDERSVLLFTMESMGLSSEVEYTDTNEVTELFIAFSPARETSELYAAQLAEGYERLRASGRVAEILARYGLAE